MFLRTSRFCFVCILTLLNLSLNKTASIILSQLWETIYILSLGCEWTVTVGLNRVWSLVSDMTERLTLANFYKPVGGGVSMKDLQKRVFLSSQSTYWTDLRRESMRLIRFQLSLPSSRGNKPLKPDHEHWSVWTPPAAASQAGAESHLRLEAPLSKHLSERFETRDSRPWATMTPGISPLYFLTMTRWCLGEKCSRCRDICAALHLLSERQSVCLWAKTLQHSSSLSVFLFCPFLSLPLVCCSN